MSANQGNWNPKHLIGAHCPLEDSETAQPAPAEPSDVETLAATFHGIYQREAKRQGNVRHSDIYAHLPENVKQFDRVLAEYVLEEYVLADELLAHLRECGLNELLEAGQAMMDTECKSLSGLRAIQRWKYAKAKLLAKVPESAAPSVLCAKCNRPANDECHQPGFIYSLHEFAAESGKEK